MEPGEWVRRGQVLAVIDRIGELIAHPRDDLGPGSGEELAVGGIADLAGDVEQASARGYLDGMSVTEVVIRSAATSIAE